MTKYYGFSKEKVLQINQKIINSFDKIVTPLPETLHHHLQLCENSNSLKAHFDLYLSATYLDNQIDVIVTNNPKDFRNVKEIQVIDFNEELVP